MGEVIVAKTLLGENVSAYFDVKSCKHSKAGLFVLGLTLLVSGQAQASAPPLESRTVEVAQNLPDLQLNAQSCCRPGFTAVMTSDTTIDPDQPVGLLPSAILDEDLPVGFSSTEQVHGFYPRQIDLKLQSSLTSANSEGKKGSKITVSFETAASRDFLNQHLVATNLERPEAQNPVSTSAADLASPVLDTRPAFLPFQDHAGAATSINREQEALQGEQFVFDFDESGSISNSNLAVTQVLRYEEGRSSSIAQAGTDDSEAAEEEATEDPTVEDSDLADPELGIIRIRSAVEDPELGIIRIREQIPVLPPPVASEPSPIAFFTGRISFVNSSNIFLSVDPVLGVVSDQFVRPGISLGIYPALADQTFLIATADLNFQRYLNTRTANYDEVRLRLGVRQGLTPRSYAQISWTYQELFRPTLKDRFFENDAVELLLARRDALTPELALNSYYQIQMNFSTPQAFDRLIQFAGAYLSYQISPRWQAGINYQLTLADYTAFERFDTYQQVIGQLVYQLSPDVRLSLFGGFSFGRSSVQSVQFDDTILGVSLEGTWALF
ncbi:MAG TPA: hypothetical protein V6D29_20175 [Leptolyngbyaceae cyanobacterium]